MSNERTKGSALALLPLGVFLVLFIGSGIISGDFYKMPTLVAFIISTSVAFLFNRKVDFNTKMEVFCLVLFIGSGIISGDFYKMPTLVAFIISTSVAFLFNRKVDFNTKMEVFCKGDI